MTTYVLATALRDFRDNFAAELWGCTRLFGTPAGVFTSAELPVGSGRAGRDRQVIVKVQDNRARARGHSQR